VANDTDATLSSLEVNGVTVAGFASGTLIYDVILPAGTTIVPTVAATVNDAGKATATVTQASSLPGTATVLVTAQDGITTETYTVNFTVAAAVIAQDIATYLAAQGCGTVGTSIFFDFQPEKPAAVLTVYDAGGPSPQEPPEAWRELHIQVRSVDHASGYTAIWKTLGALLYPPTADGTIDVNSNQYMAQLQGIPAIITRDQLNRYIWSFRVVVCNLAGNVQVDDWLAALATWTAAILPGWTVYSGWRGYKRPSVTWMLTGTTIKERGMGSFWQQKKFTCWILGRTPNEHAFGGVSIVSGLATAIKIPLDVVAGTYLTVLEPTAGTNDPSFLLSQASVTLRRVMLRPQPTAQLMEQVILSQEEVT
jgi:hypothetical protein